MTLSHKAYALDASVLVELMAGSKLVESIVKVPSIKRKPSHCFLPVDEKLYIIL